jgi:plasmid stabilization system protein ParE
VTRTLDILEEALVDAEDAARWYAERSEAAAAAFVEELDRAIAAIQHTPATWPSFDHGTRRFLLKRFPYSVVYRADDQRIVIVAVAHAHRRPAYWRGRIG